MKITYKKTEAFVKSLNKRSQEKLKVLARNDKSAESYPYKAANGLTLELDGEAVRDVLNLTGVFKMLAMTDEDFDKAEQEFQRRMDAKMDVVHEGTSAYAEDFDEKVKAKLSAENAA